MRQINEQPTQLAKDCDDFSELRGPNTSARKVSALGTLALLAGLAVGAGPSSEALAGEAVSPVPERPDTSSFFEKHFGIAMGIKSISGQRSIAGPTIELGVRPVSRAFLFGQYLSDMGGKEIEAMHIETGIGTTVSPSMDATFSASWLEGPTDKSWSTPAFSFGARLKVFRGSDNDVQVRSAVGVRSDQGKSEFGSSFEVALAFPGSKK